MRRIVESLKLRSIGIDYPSREGGLLDLMKYDCGQDTLELMEDNLKESELFKKISKN